jgi:hypothetical protein
MALSRSPLTIEQDFVMLPADMTSVEQVLRLPTVRERPPVLVDIGASGVLHERWTQLAPHSICIAFDADERDFDASVSRPHPYRTLHLHNNIVSDRDTPYLDFYLTRSAHCSSALPPDNGKLAAWIFADLFDVEKQTRLRSRTLASVLEEHQLGYVDWFKTDSQGTDLRLFLSLGDAMVRRVIAADFEPGLIDAYVGEDKLHAVLARMDQLPFWISELRVRGTQRLSRLLWEQRVRPLTRGVAPLSLRNSPGWAEVSYLNTLDADQSFDQRDFLVAWVIASVQRQFGFALEIAVRGEERFGDPVFAELADDSLSALGGVVDRLVPTLAKRGIGLLKNLIRSRLGGV